MARYLEDRSCIGTCSLRLRDPAFEFQETGLLPHAQQSPSNIARSFCRSAEGSRSIEDIVREMLKPMLKTWLEDNLPSLVERLVRAEIERVSRGGR